MNYKRIYDSIIQNRMKNPKTGGYVEIHHIVPKSLGGTDSSDNLVKLTAKEHFICHCLLAKMYKFESFEWYKMNLAFAMMKVSSSNQNRYFNSRLYNLLKIDRSKLMSKAQSGSKNSQFGKMWIHNVKTGQSASIKRFDPIPDGWSVGRVIKKEKVRKKKKCVHCGLNDGKHIFCSKYRLIPTLVANFGFDETTKGTEKLEQEFLRIINEIDHLYNVNGMSVEELKNHFKLNHNETMRKIMNSLGIDRRTISTAMKKYYIS